MYSNNVFLGVTEEPQDVTVASLTALNLDPDENVITDETGKLISGGSGASVSLQDAYNDSTTTNVKILTDSTRFGIGIKEGFHDLNRTLYIMNLAQDITTSIQADGTLTTVTINSDSIILTGGVNGALQLDVYTPAEIDTLNTNLGTIEEKVVQAYNESSKRFDLIQSGIVYKGQLDILACPIYDMRFSFELLTGNTYFQKLFCPHTALISHIKLFLVTNSAGPINFAIYDIENDDLIEETTVQIALTNGTFFEIPFVNPQRLNSGKEYWIAITQHNNGGTSWQLGHTTTNVAGSEAGSVGYLTDEISYRVAADYSGGGNWPATIPSGTAVRERFWYQLVNKVN